MILIKTLSTSTANQVGCLWNHVYGERRLGKGNHVEASACVVTSVGRNYKLKDGKITGFLAVYENVLHQFHSGGD